MAEQEVPIDIHASKLLDWLITRRHIAKDYQLHLNKIREKILEAIQDMPAHPKITQLLAGTQLNYFNCKQIVEILKETEADSKNIFGYYSSKRVKDWQEIVKLYEKDDVYLAEAASQLHRNVNFEVPTIRKQLNKFQSNGEDYMRKAADCANQANKLKAEYHTFADKLGIKGDDIHIEFQNLIQNLPKYMDEVIQELPKLSEAREYYLEFLKFIDKRENVECLPCLKYLITKGNTTVYEYKNGVAPTTIEENVTHYNEPSEVQYDDQEIDFGDDAIDIGHDTDSSSPSNGNGDFVHVEKEECLDEGEINWDIEAVEISPGDSLQDKSETCHIARGTDALTLLEYPMTRNNLINELHELEGFFDQRIFEMKMDEHILSANQFQGAPTILQMTSIDKLSAQMKQVQKILQMMTNEKINLIFMMRDDRKYIDNAVNKMKSKLELVDKALVKSKLMEEKAKEETRQGEKIAPEIPKIIKRTKELQKQIEVEISKRYKGRPVNIMGGYQIL
ncbi:CDK5 regulatory subunit-associated protein 3 [Tetranychus urticae]|uniref:CDK5 regulatory subunit-associated protein 3 n=1 Tax=Tetranychus urticae TaxID=32264 RepID=UPI00077B9431|nr:CDK5 regulatory subunit-associated protein 3 [Tetranychus urticae]